MLCRPERTNDSIVLAPRGIIAGGSIAVIVGGCRDLSELLVYGTYGYAAIVASLTAGSVFYSRRSTKIAWALRAWAFVVAALLVLALGALASSLHLVALDPPSTMAQHVVRLAGPSGDAVQSAYGLTVLTLLFFATIQFARTFRRAQGRRVPIGPARNYVPSRGSRPTGMSSRRMKERERTREPQEGKNLEATMSAREAPRRGEVTEGRGGSEKVSSDASHPSVETDVRTFGLRRHLDQPK